MSVESAAGMFEMPFRKKPRAGQQEVLDECRRRLLLTVKLPTGYGKTLAACFVYSLKKITGAANRLLWIFPSDSQLEQFIQDGPADLTAAGIEGPIKVVDIRHAGHRAIKDHRSNTAQVFAITIQSLVEARGSANVAALLETGQWMIVVDEYHHYGAEKSWGRRALDLNRAFLLAMSATPDRPGKDSAFGSPHVSVTYRRAQQEGAVKRLWGHAYSYRIEAISDTTAETFVFTTAELIKEAGGDDPEKIEKLRVERKMRWSPKYVSPLVSIPIERMMNTRTATGHPLQALISAMCVSHARLVCEQIQAMYPELQVDWVGTGQDGRSDDENTRALEKFCPRKDEDGRRHPTLDVLVHVGMAGEGLDLIHVSEVVLLCNASICNRILQIIGRGARNLLGVDCNISFDSSSEFSEYVGTAIMDAMDFAGPQKDPDYIPPDDWDWPPPPPENPDIHILDVELLNVDSGMESVQRMAKVMEELAPGSLNFEELRRNLKHPDWQSVTDTYRKMRKLEAEVHDERSVIEQWRDKVKYQVSSLSTIVLILLKSGGRSIDDPMKMRGEIKKRISGRKKQLFGPVENDLELLKKHYGWCVSLDRDLRERKSLPSWLYL